LRDAFQLPRAIFTSVFVRRRSKPTRSGCGDISANYRLDAGARAFPSGLAPRSRWKRGATLSCSGPNG